MNLSTIRSIKGQFTGRQIVVPPCYIWVDRVKNDGQVAYRFNFAVIWSFTYSNLKINFER